MRIIDFYISHYKSIERIIVNFPENSPVVLFGPNNAGKSNILSSINLILGEKYPANIDLDDSDYYLRKKADYPEINFKATFDGPYYNDRYTR